MPALSSASVAGVVRDIEGAWRRTEAGSVGYHTERVVRRPYVAMGSRVQETQ